MDHVQNRRVAVGIKPPARELKRRPLTHPEAEQIAIEPARRLEVVAQHGEMFHGRDTHQKNSFIGAINAPNAYSEAGCGVNESMGRKGLMADVPAWPEGRKMRKNDQVPKLQRVIEELPAGFDALRAEARDEGYRFAERLAADWLSGTIRFDREGEGLLAARVNGVLAGIGGLTIEPVVPDALRMRRFYVRLAYRRSGIGRKLATALLERARSASGLV
jgi:GNAT superfamily N-acetyltransferase